VIDVSAEPQQSGTVVIKRERKRHLDHGFDMSNDAESPIRRNPKKSKKRKIVQNGAAPLSASYGNYELPPQDEQLLEEVAGFLSRCSKKKARLSSIGSYLSDIGYHYDGALCPTLMQNRHLFKILRNPQGRYTITLKQQQAPREPPTDLAGADYDEPYPYPDDPSYDDASMAPPAPHDHFDYEPRNTDLPLISSSDPADFPRRRAPASSIGVVARSANQQRLLDLLDSAAPVIVAVGPAGTGKTFLAVRAALRALADGEVSGIVVTRPAVAVDESLGFLPGNVEDKMAPYLAPISDILTAACDPAELDDLMRRRVIKVRPAGRRRPGRRGEAAPAAAE
jgi:hypothetical protein